MADHSHIEWTDATWNPITGCSVISPGCKDCYAMGLAGTRLRSHPSRAGLTVDTKAGPVWTGEVRFNEAWLTQPLSWARPRDIFVCAHSDLFHENVPDAWIDRIFAVMALAPHHRFQVLTKRAARMRAYYEKLEAEAKAAGERTDLVPRRIDASAADLTCTHGDALEEAPWPLPNVWLGVSAEDQARADERIPELLATPAAVRWVSVEPMIGPVDLTSVQAPRFVPEDHELDWKFSALDTGDYYQFQDSMGVWEGGDGPWRDARLDWVVLGGESGRSARPMHPHWARQVRDACTGAGVAFFFKQWGEWIPCIEADDGEREFCVADDGGPEERFEDFPARAIRRLNGQPMWRVGKKAAGRLLDGRTWDERPVA